MNNREILELLELAAKAASYEHKVTNEGSILIRLEDGLWRPWNPLIDDGDALRLAVKLKLAIRPLDKCVFVESNPETLLGQSLVSELEMYGNHPAADEAARHAIVRAAAAIGRGME